MKVSEQTTLTDVLRAYAKIVEKNPDKKYELIHNEIIEMAGALPEHTEITENFLFYLRLALMNAKQETIYKFYNGETGVSLPEANFYSYPDGYLVEGLPERTTWRKHVWLLNPCLILEVLSESTKARDRNEKRELYQQIPTLQTYLLAAQDAPRVERYEREAETWRHEVLEGLDAAFTVLNGAAELWLADLYRGVNFGNQ